MIFFVNFYKALKKLCALFVASCVFFGSQLFSPDGVNKSQPAARGRGQRSRPTPQQFRLMTQARVCVRKNTNAQARRCLNVCILYSVRTVCTHMQPHNRHNDKLSLHLHWIK